MKSLVPNEDYSMDENKPSYSEPRISIQINKNPALVESGNHKRYNIEYTGIKQRNNLELVENTTDLANSVGNLNIAIDFDYSDDLYKSQRAIYEENGSSRSQENDVYPENYIIESLIQTLKVRMDGINSTNLLSMPTTIIVRTTKSPKDYQCVLERKYFSNIGSSFNADYNCEGLPNINDYEGNLELIFKR